jgi:hypothetical protein
MSCYTLLYMQYIGGFFQFFGISELPLLDCVTRVRQANVTVKITALRYYWRTIGLTVVLKLHIYSIC